MVIGFSLVKMLFLRVWSSVDRILDRATRVLRKIQGPDPALLYFYSPVVKSVMGNPGPCGHRIIYEQSQDLLPTQLINLILCHP